MKETDWPGDDLVCLNFVYGNYIDEVLLCQDGAGNRYRYYLHDHLYSPVAAIGYWGAVLERYEYDVYGARRVFDNSWQARTYSWYGSEVGLTGRNIDMLDWNAYAVPRLQHMHYSHRDYSPAIGRFMQQDSWGGVLSAKNAFFYPMAQYFDSVNIYEFLVSHPVNKNDPYGLITATECYQNLQQAQSKATTNLASCALECAGVFGKAQVQCALGCAAIYATGGGTVAFKTCMKACTGANSLIGIICQGWCMRGFAEEMDSALDAYKRCNDKACGQI